MRNPYTVSDDDPDFVVLRWETRVSSRPTPDQFQELRQLVQRGKPVLFDFTATRSLGTRWLRLAHRLCVESSEMGKELLVVGLNEVLLEKADVIAIISDLRTFPTIEEARER
jgi:hypothetical protein